MGDRPAESPFESEDPGARDRAVAALRVDLLNGQFDLRERDFAVLVLVAGNDAHGIEAVYDRASEWLDARYVRFATYHDRVDAERLRPDFWPYWCRLPPRGSIGVHYGGWVRDAALARLAGDLSGKAWRRRLARIAAFERALLDDGTLLVKLDIHVSPELLAKRAEATRRWRPDPTDRFLFRSRRRVEKVSRDIRSATADDRAPWITIDGADQRRRDFAAFAAIRDVLVARLAAPAPEPPPPVLAPLPAGGILADLPAPAAWEPDAWSGHDPEVLDAAAMSEAAALRDAMRAAERRGIGVVVAFEGHDAAGKGGAIRRITRALPAYQYEVHPIAAPSESERRHHWLRRFWTRLPRAGRMAIFDRSWYGRVLVERVEGFAPESAWRRGYGEIVEFERNLRDRGFVLVKFWLEVSPGEQARRFAARRETAFKKYKFTDEDVRNSARRPAYELAAEEMFVRTARPKAPWRVLPADDKRLARVLVLGSLREAIERAVRKAR